ncbi:MAG: helix-turn-helix domain-containing protein [Clostridia bacterium]|nr:helix-turn-helix domain-containing protein [Clostridia bacterium]
MRQKIDENKSKNRYSQSVPAASFEAYVSKNGGWTDYLISQRILFSHRANDYDMSDLPEKLHSHDYYELTVVLAEGGVEYIADGQSISLRPGMAILTKPMQFHMFRLTEAMHYERYVLYFKEIEALLPDPALMDFTKRGGLSCAIFQLSEERLLSCLKSAGEALSDPASPYANAKACLHLLQVFMLLSDQEKALEGSLSALPPHFIHEIKEYVDENFLSIPSVEALARKFFYSREYISRAFRRYYNTPIYEYILGRKMQYSTLLLHEGSAVEAAAHASGFGSLSGFVKHFRKFYGCTPSEYKAKHTP